ncbi:MAG: archaeosortase/exosortase family protein [Cyanobacteriota bacterium]
MTSFKDQTSNREAVAPSTWEKLKSNATDLKMWLFFATANIALWHGVLNNRLGGEDTVTTAFFWLTALFLLWKKRYTLRISPQPLGSTMGLLLLAWVLFRGSATFWFEHDVVQLLPVAAFFALTLIASGWKGLSQYFRPFLALFIFSLAGVLIELFFKANPAGFSFSRLTAQVSAFLLHYVGFDVTQEGVYIYLTQGSVEVLYFCTGGPLIALLFQLTLVLMLITPISWNLLWKLLSGIVGVGFFLGTVRVAILAVVVSDKEAFDYWHGSEGNQIFSLIAFSLWIIAAHFIYEHYEKQAASQTVSNKTEETEETDTSEEKRGITSEETVTTFSFSNPRSWLIPIASIVMLAVTVITFMIPGIGRREIQPLQFPNQLSLAGWNLENSESLVKKPETELRLHRLRSGQEYEYQQ